MGYNLGNPNPCSFYTLNIQSSLHQLKVKEIELQPFILKDIPVKITIVKSGNRKRCADYYKKGIRNYPVMYKERYSTSGDFATGE
jgi:hypothetical protein